MAIEIFGVPERTDRYQILEVFDTSTTWTVPPEITQCAVFLIGGGGGGGNGSQKNGISNSLYRATGGSGGGPSTISYDLYYSVTPGEQISITIGAGGSAAQSGTTSTFGNLTSSRGRGGKNGSLWNVDNQSYPKTLTGTDSATTIFERATSSEGGTSTAPGADIEEILGLVGEAGFQGETNSGDGGAGGIAGFIGGGGGGADNNNNNANRTGGAAKSGGGGGGGGGDNTYGGGGAAGINTGAGGGGAGSSYEVPNVTGPGGNGGSGLVIVYY